MFRGEKLDALKMAAGHQVGEQWMWDSAAVICSHMSDKLQSYLRATCSIPHSLCGSLLSVDAVSPGPLLPGLMALAGNNTHVKAPLREDLT